ncbi:ester cyclase [Leisingera sp. XS_AS12]|jgi:ketosteroid isomerase-like protein|uniref:ester cyclase n=1 Tax=Leisingera sp. XS_AS12 TaxID=3241294 RepID=UPI001C95BC42|nr:ester cyclase [Nocardioides marinus]
MTKTEILQAWYDQAWSRGDLSDLERFYTADVTATGVVPSLPLNRNDFQDFVAALRHQVKQIAISITQAVEQGEWLAARIEFNGCCAATDAPIQTTGQVMIRFKDGKMAQSYGQFDYITLFEQLGQLPQDTIAACLAGQGLTWR